MRAMNHPDYQPTRWTDDRRARASVAAKDRAAKRNRLPLPEGYRGAVATPDDFARCSVERQITIMSALLRLMEIYRNAEGSTERKLHVALMNEWNRCSSVIAQQAGQTRPLP